MTAERKNTQSGSDSRETCRRGTRNANWERSQTDHRTERRRKSLVGLWAGWTFAFRKSWLQKVAKERKITKP